MSARHFARVASLFFLLLISGSFDAYADTERKLIAAIQSQLEILGYEPGPPSGELNQRTRVAISSFQRHAAIAVTGQPSLALARMLYEVINGQRQVQIPSDYDPDKAQAAAWPRSPSRHRHLPVPPPPMHDVPGLREVRGAMRFQRDAGGALQTCSIAGQVLDVSWCQSFTDRKHTDNCRVLVRPDQRVLVVSCAPRGG